MVKDPRPHKPGSSDPDEALDLLRALARSQAPRQPSPQPSRQSPHPAPHAQPPEPAPGGEKLDALRELAEKLDFQLRGPTDGGPAADAPPYHGAPETPSDLADDARSGGRVSLVPRFGAQQKVFVLIALAVLAIAAVGGVMRGRTPPASAPAPAPAAPTQPAPAPAVPPAQIVPPTQVVPPVDQGAAPAAAPADIGAITKAMSDCDTAAAQDPQSLHFLVLPLLPARGEQEWRAVALQIIGNSYFLLSAKEAIDALRDGRLVMRPGRYTFSVLDAGSGATYSWNSATGLARLSKRDAGAVKSLKLGFDFSDTQAGAQWSAEFKRDPGACYWVMVLVR
jgi:hypothetical protein